MTRVLLAACLVIGFALRTIGEDESGWPAPVPGFKPPEPGEHPRLFFRKWELPEIRKRAETPEGKAIVARLRYVLNAGDGRSLPTAVKGEVAQLAKSRMVSFPADVTDPDELERIMFDRKLGRYYTLWHAAGYGMLYQLSGEKAFAELGRTCVEAAMKGDTGWDDRYSFRKMTGALRNGPALGAIAMAYDLCYDGWDESFRRKVCKAIEFYKPIPGTCTLEYLARGGRHGPGSNHWGPQLGGGALACLAVRNDPGVDNARIDRILQTNIEAYKRQCNQGQGDHGYYSQHVGAGQITTDTAFIPGVQAWRVAGGLDFAKGRPEIPWCTVRWAMWLVPTPLGPQYPNPIRWGCYGGQMFTRHGLSRGGQFAQGFGTVSPEQKAALLWTYNTVLKPTEAALHPGAGLGPGESSYDTLSPEPHRAVLALVNWPIGVEPVNPGNVLPRMVVDERHQWYVFRQRWRDEDDIIVVNLLGGPRGDYFGLPKRLRIWGMGKRFMASSVGGDPTHFSSHGDHAWALAWKASEGARTGALTVDYSGHDGCDAVVLVSGADIMPDHPEPVGRPEPGSVDLTGRWVRAKQLDTTYCQLVQRGNQLFFPDVKGPGKGSIDGFDVVLKRGRETLKLRVSSDGNTLAGGKRRWLRAGHNAESAKPEIGGDLLDVEPDTLTMPDLTGDWVLQARKPDTLRLVQKGLSVSSVPQDKPAGTVHGHMVGLSAVLNRQWLGTVSPDGNIMSFKHVFRLYREGSPAALPSYTYAPGDRVKLSEVEVAGKKVNVFTFHEQGKHPAIGVDGQTLTVGSRSYAWNDGVFSP